MDKKTYMVAGAVLLTMVAVAGIIYWQMPKKNFSVTPFISESELNEEKQSFDRDMADLEEIGDETTLDDMGDGLVQAQEDINKLPPSSDNLDAMEKELSYETDNLAADLTELESLANDSSLDNLGNELSGI